MLLEKPKPQTVTVSLVVEDERERPRAREVVTKLRAAGIGVYEGFSGNAKKRVEVARRRGHDGVVFIRSVDNPAGDFNLQRLDEVEGEDDGRTRTAVFKLLGLPLEGESGWEGERRS